MANSKLKRILLFAWLWFMAATSTVAQNDRSYSGKQRPDLSPAVVSITPARRTVEARPKTSQQTVATVSAASYGAEVAPGEIVAAFGSRLATQTVIATDADPNTPGIQLPTELGGTTVEVNGRRAGLFFVSPTQINYLMPTVTETGSANVVVRSGDGTVSNGTAQVLPSAPSLFTANSSGAGVPAGSVLRVLPSGAQTEEPLFQFDPATGIFTPRPISLGAEGERVFLILYLTGLGKAIDPNNDANFNEAIHVLLGGNEIVPAYAGAQGTFIGLDQINIEIPRSMLGRGAVNLAVNYSRLFTSNVARIEIIGTSSVSVSGIAPATALAGSEITINGAGFAASTADNQVFIIDAQEQPFRAKIIAATPNQLRVLVPFGAGAGRVLVRTSAGEAMSSEPLTIRASVSGFVEDAGRQPLAGVSVRLLGGSSGVTTSAEGVFLLPDVPANTTSQPVAQLEIDASGLIVSQPFPKVIRPTTVRANRDNQFPNFIALQRNQSFAGNANDADSAAPDQQSTTITGFVFESDGATPVARALVVANGRAAFTDSTGRYVLLEVTGTTAALDAAALRPDGRVDRAGNRIASLVLTGNVIVAPNLILQSATANRPPVLLAPTALAINPGATLNANVYVSDPDAGQTVQVGVSGAGFASVSASGGPAYTLRLAPGLTEGGQFTLTLTARDNLGATTSQTVALRVNRPPTATAQTVAANEATAKTIMLTGNDADGDALTFTIVAQPARGKLTAATGADVTYIPPLNFSGTDSFTFKVSDGLLESATATVTINVAAIADARRAAPLAAGVSVMMPSPTDLAAKLAPFSSGVSVLVPSASDATSKIAPLSAGVSVQVASSANAASQAAPLSAGVSVQLNAATGSATNVAPLSAGVSVQFASSANAASQTAPLSAGVSVQLPSVTSAAGNIAPVSAGVSVQASPASATAGNNRKSKTAPQSKPPP